ncbi:MAG: TIGR00295 family protein [Nitrospirae bacterium]|nr:TIGR00295 family protein [Nitrospirota bacterium]
MMPDKYVAMLRDAGCPENVVAHCLSVRNTAMSIAARVKSVDLDLELLEAGAMLHDIGRSRTHGITHAVEGARIARETGIDERIARIIERHIGAGIAADEAALLGLPSGDYVPETPEEKIVAHADNLTKGHVEVSFEECLEMFERRLGSDNPAVGRVIRLHREIEGWMGNAAA